MISFSLIGGLEPNRWLGGLVVWWFGGVEVRFNGKANLIPEGP